MHYVMADLHGETGRWQGMLREISFSDRDTIYILGDVVDRGGIGGVDILLDIMDRPNVVMLLGNHEAMCLKATGGVPLAPQRRRGHPKRPLPAGPGETRGCSGLFAEAAGSPGGGGWRTAVLSGPWLPGGQHL